MAVKDIEKKLKQYVSEVPSKWKQEANWRQKNRQWLKKSQAVALKILTRLDDLNITQKELAEKIGVSPQQVNKWVKGRENFTIETISKLEVALNCEIISVLGSTRLNSTTYQNVDITPPSVLHALNYQTFQNTSYTKIIPLNNSCSSNKDQFNMAV